MRAQIKEKREVAKSTLLVLFDLLGRESVSAPRLRDSAFKRSLAELPVGAEVDV